MLVSGGVLTKNAQPFSKQVYQDLFMNYPPGNQQNPILEKKQIMFKEFKSILWGRGDIL